MIYQHEIEERRARATYDPGDREFPSFAGSAYWRDQDEYLYARNLSAVTARLNGWYPSFEAGDNLLRIVMPASPAALKFWQARAIDDVEKRYQSPHGSSGPAVIVCYPAPVAKTDVVVIVEGPMDALAAAGARCIGISLMGNTPSRERLDYIAQTFEGLPMILVPDRDALAEASRTLVKLAQRGAQIEMLSALPWKDLADVPVEQRRLVLGLGR